MHATETHPPVPGCAREVVGGTVGPRALAMHWLAALEESLDLERQGHFLSTFTPALVQHFRAEEAALEVAGALGRQRHRRAHHRLAARLTTLMAEHARGREVATGIRHLLEAWLLHQEGDQGAAAKRRRGH